MTAASAGWTLGDVARAAKTAPGVEYFRTKNTGRGSRQPHSAGEAHDRLARQWAKAQQYAALQRPLPAAEEPRDLTELGAIVTDVDDLLTRLLANAGRWGRAEAAISQRTILTALAYLTLQTGKHAVAASIRDLDLMSGLGRTTAATALHALAESGFIQRVRGADGGNAAEWELIRKFSTIPGTVRSQPSNNPRPPPEIFALRAELVRTIEYQLTDQLHDLFTRQGLGHLAKRIDALLREHAALTIESAARLLGVSLRHAATILSRLRQYRLIVKHSEGWARSRRDLRTVAARVLGVEGMLDVRRDVYEAEHEVWAWWQAEHATMTSTPRQRPRRPHVSSRPLFEASTPGERVWPRYSRSPDGRADHRQAREYVDDGVLNPESRWQLFAA